MDPRLLRKTINCKRYAFRNYGDGWDVYCLVDYEPKLVEEGCASLEAAYQVAEEHSKEV